VHFNLDFSIAQCFFLKPLQSVFLALIGKGSRGVKGLLGSEIRIGLNPTVSWPFPLAISWFISAKNAFSNGPLFCGARALACPV
jgi:hypothetical protein